MKVLRARASVVRVQADRVAEFPEDAQQPAGPEGARVLVRAWDLMVDVEDHGVLNRWVRDPSCRGPV
jgi:hypothetical protein